MRIFCLPLISLTFGLALAGEAASAASLPARAPGLWQSTTSVTGANGKKLPGAQDVVTVSCVDAANDAKFFLSNARECASLTVTGSGAHYRIDGVCTNANTGHRITIRETLDYASPKQVTLTAELAAPSGPMKLVSDLQWQGPCLAGMRPGDEGSLVDGAFSKADNINDSANQ